MRKYTRRLWRTMKFIIHIPISAGERFATHCYNICYYTADVVKGAHVFVRCVLAPTARYNIIYYTTVYIPSDDNEKTVKAVVQDV